MRTRTRWLLGIAAIFAAFNLLMWAGDFAAWLRALGDESSMNTITALWTGALLSVFGGAVAFGFAILSSKLREQRALRGHWLALRADIRRCGNLAAGYLVSGISMPTTRMPLGAYTVSMPALLMAHKLTDQEFDALSQFFDSAAGFNRSLEYAQEASTTERAAQTGRAQVKAGNIAPGQPQFESALEIVSKHIQARTGHRLQWWKQND